MAEGTEVMIETNLSDTGDDSKSRGFKQACESPSHSSSQLLPSLSALTEAYEAELERHALAISRHNSHIKKSDTVGVKVTSRNSEGVQQRRKASNGDFGHRYEDDSEYEDGPSILAQIRADPDLWGENSLDGDDSECGDEESYDELLSDILGVQPPRFLSGRKHKPGNSIGNEGGGEEEDDSNEWKASQRRAVSVTGSGGRSVTNSPEEGYHSDSSNSIMHLEPKRNAFGGMDGSSGDVNYLINPTVEGMPLSELASRVPPEKLWQERYIFLQAALQLLDLHRGWTGNAASNKPLKAAILKVKRLQRSNTGGTSTAGTPSRRRASPSNGSLSSSTDKFSGPPAYWCGVNDGWNRARVELRYGSLELSYENPTLGPEQKVVIVLRKRFAGGNNSGSIGSSISSGGGGGGGGGSGAGGGGSSSNFSPNIGNTSSLVSRGYAAGCIVKEYKGKGLSKSDAQGSAFEVTDLDGEKWIFLANSKKETKKWMRLISEAIAEPDGSFTSRWQQQQQQQQQAQQQERFGPGGHGVLDSVLRAQHEAHMRTFTKTREDIENSKTKSEYLRAIHGIAAQTSSLKMPIPWVKRETFGQMEGGLGAQCNSEHPVRSDITQLWKDMRRDRVTVVGEPGNYSGAPRGIGRLSRDDQEPISGDSAGPESIVGALVRRLMKCASSVHKSSPLVRLTELGALHVARDVLLACNRTQSGGDTYFCVDALLSKPDLVVLCPIAADADPIVIQVEIAEAAAVLPDEIARDIFPWHLGNVSSPGDSNLDDDSAPEVRASRKGKRNKRDFTQKSSRGNPRQAAILSPDASSGGASAAKTRFRSPKSNVGASNVSDANTSMCLRISASAVTGYRICTANPQDDGDDTWAQLSARWTQEFIVYASPTADNPMHITFYTKDPLVDLSRALPPAMPPTAMPPTIPSEPKDPTTRRSPLPPTPPPMTLLPPQIEPSPTVRDLLSDSSTSLPMSPRPWSSTSVSSPSIERYLNHVSPVSVDSTHLQPHGRSSAPLGNNNGELDRHLDKFISGEDLGGDFRLSRSQSTA